MDATGYGLLVALVLIVGRMLAAYGAVIVTWIASHFITVADRSPGLKAPLLLGWTGMRGVVSLAAALSIPVMFNNGVAFPQRNLILYITFVVILVTLVLQGLTLPVMIRKIKLPAFDDHIPEEEVEARIRESLAKTALDYLNENHKAALTANPGLQRLANNWELQLLGEDAVAVGERKTIYLDVLEKQRALLLMKNKNYERIDEEVIRKFLHHIDLEEEKLRSL
ncbi:cation:proton antiporter domain-containing protein [Chitinophaga sedimenti]|uniref:cation:proton antiporter domain-containing protein n=1 Tax=Chitinophaga sedimenti TaxID=2033606 RepID=UPI0027E2016F|nr:cation:proton antiporter [Chitinophaga sedimenti]